MKKLLYAAFYSALISFGFIRVVNAFRDNFDNERLSTWRSSRTCTQDGFTILSTGPVYFHAVVVESPTVNTSDSGFYLFNTSSPRADLMQVSTAGQTRTDLTFINIGAVFGSTSLAIAPLLIPDYYDVPLSSGAGYNKRGSACIRCLWDYLKNRPDSDFPVKRVP